ncbi:ComEC/Rec2 family competence protein [Georgenia sp. AZ-5]|uniref:ComEC/Rec2 family competence protein n=1 Tax=Georgenia sp. AZ-5 TaxID=3367526 RepID=UPI003754BBC2
MSGDGASRSRAPRPPPLDLRLVPAALTAWSGASLAVTRPAAELLLAAGLATAGIAALAAGLLRRGGAGTWRRGPRQGPLAPRHRGAPAGPATVLLAAAVLLAVLLSAAPRVHERESGLLAELTELGASAVLTGRVATEPRPVAPREWEAAPRQRLELTVEEVRGRGQVARARTSVVVVGPDGWSGVRLGERVRLRATLVATEPGDAAAALAVTADPPRPAGGARWPLTAVNRLRGALGAVTADLSPQARGLVPGIAVGDDRALPPDLAADMRATSLTHLTAVSGAHVAIVLGAVLGALAWAPRRWRSAGAALALVAFVTLVRPEASVLRAAAMGAVVLAALLLGRPARALPGLCAAVVALVVADPWLARSYGFALSVLATAGLVLLARPWARWLSHLLPRWLATAVAIPAAAQAMCGPVVVLLSPALSPYAVPANLLAAPAVPPATVLGVAATLLAPAWPGGAHALAVLASGCTWWIATVARTLARLPGAQLPWPPGATGALALVVVSAVVVALLARAGPRRLGWRAVVPLAAVAAVLLLPGPRWVTSWLPDGWPPRGWLALQCDVGQGGAFLVRSGEGAAVMVDVGPAGGAAAGCLRAAGVERLELLVLTHAHADHVGGLGDVLAAVAVDRVLLGPGPEPAQTVAAVLRQLEGVPTARPVADGGTAAGTAGTIAWEVLWPPAAGVRALPGPDGVNDLSLALRLRAPGLDVLVPGDLEHAGQAGLLARLRARAPDPADVVAVAHHGSARQDPALAAWLRPRLAVVSVGSDNDYGHPAPSALHLYESTGAVVLRTDLCGAIAVVPDGDGLAAVSGCPP